ncbi:MAG: hypothetical protein PHF97_12530 [Bacteroidales bacterium]|nr:hypothetical protein [Bacteroidales bacterium]
MKLVKKKLAVESRGMKTFLEDREVTYVTSRGASAILRFCQSHLYRELKAYSEANFNLRKIPSLADYFYILKQADYIKFKILSSNIDHYKKKSLHERFDLLYKTKIRIGLQDLITSHDALKGTNSIILEMKVIYEELNREFISA